MDGQTVRPPDSSGDSLVRGKTSPVNPHKYENRIYTNLSLPNHAPPKAPRLPVPISEKKPLDTKAHDPNANPSLGVKPWGRFQQSYNPYQRRITRSVQTSISFPAKPILKDLKPYHRPNSTP